MQRRFRAENTLDYWAGYAPNSDDAARLKKKMAEPSGTAPLLKPAGSFAGQGQDDEELIFDLGGNVAEWVLAARLVLAGGRGRALVCGDEPNYSNGKN
jgi:hypothetical protein